MDELLFMSKLQAISYLFHIGDDCGQGQGYSPGVSLAQGTVGSKVHDQERRLLLYTKVQHADDIGMDQPYQVARFLEKFVHIIASQLAVQDFDRGLRAQVNMLAQVDLGEAAFAEQTDQAIMTKLLSRTICHCFDSLFIRSPDQGAVHTCTVSSTPDEARYLPSRDLATAFTPVV